MILMLLFMMFVTTMMMCPVTVQADYPSIENTDYPYYTSISDAADDMREQMVTRNENCYVYYLDPEKKDFDVVEEELYDEIMKYTGEPDEGDYLKGAVCDHDWHMTRTPYKEGYLFFITYEVEYYTDYNEEVEVQNLMGNLDLFSDYDNPDDYQKAFAIYQYITQNVIYDTEHKHTDYGLRHTSYAALVNGTATCKGYAVTFYYLALLNGLDCRVVRNEDHSWNIVKIGDRWYYCDSCWDAGNDDFKYFLIGEDDLENHEGIYDLYSCEISEESCIYIADSTVLFESSPGGTIITVSVTTDEGTYLHQNEDYSLIIDTADGMFLVSIEGIGNIYSVLEEQYKMTLLQRIVSIAI